MHPHFFFQKKNFQKRNFQKKNFPKKELEKNDSRTKGPGVSRKEQKKGKMEKGSKRARRSQATYPFVGLNAEGPNFADIELLAFCGVSVPHGHGLVLLDAEGAQVPFRSLQAQAPCRAPAHAATLRLVRESAAECAGERPADRGSQALRVFLVRDSAAFTIPLELHDEGFAPATCARGTRLRIDDAAIVPLSSSTVAELARLARCLALFPPFGAFKPSTPLPLSDLVRVLRELRKATRPIPVVITHELALVLRLVERAAPGTARRVLSPPYAPLVNVGLSLGELARTISAVLGAEACAQGSPLRAPCNWSCARARGAGGAAPHPASPDGTFAVFTARGELLGARGFRLMFPSHSSRCTDGAFRVRFDDPLTGISAELDEDPRSPVLFAPEAEPLKGRRMPPSAPFGTFVDHGASRVLALFRRVFQPCADAAAHEARTKPNPRAALSAAFARRAAQCVAALPVVQTVAVELTPHSCGRSVAVLLALLRADACVLCGEPAKIAHVARILVHGFDELDGVAFTCPISPNETADIYFASMNPLATRARSFVFRPCARASAYPLTNVGRAFVEALRDQPERAFFVCLATAPVPTELPPSYETDAYGAVFSDLAALVYRSGASTLRLPQAFVCGLSAIESTSVLPLIEFVAQGRARPDFGAQGHFALGLPMRAMVALIAQDGSPAVPTDAAVPSSCAMCAAFGRVARDSLAACGPCVGASLRAMRLIPASDALAQCSARDASALLALSDSAARAAAISEAADEHAADELERTRAARKLASLFPAIQLHTPPKCIELERRVPAIALAACSPYVYGILFEQKSDSALVLLRLGLSPYFAQ